MHARTADLRIRASKPLIAPAVLEEELPLDDEGAALVAESRRSIARILRGEDDRLLVVAGPCSIHDPVSALEYAERLRELATRWSPDVLVVMRVYFEKPRTVVGWRGLINDPHLDGSYQINTGLRLARRLLLDVTALGLPVANEFLDTTLGQYYADIVSWGAIGARTVESQIHRELASGLSMPVGFKNRTDGNIQVAIDAIRTARHPHWFPTLTREGAPAVLGTSGNDECHVVLRGGSAGPNYTSAQVRAAADQLRLAGLLPFLVVDCSHANSGKDADKQPLVAEDLARQIAGGEASICGVMLESHLIGGSQDYTTRPLVHGRSITDACLSWEKTVPLFSRLAEAVQERRRRKLEGKS